MGRPGPCGALRPLKALARVTRSSPCACSWTGPRRMLQLNKSRPSQHQSGCPGLCFQQECTFRTLAVKCKNRFERKYNMKITWRGTNRYCCQKYNNENRNHIFSKKISEKINNENIFFIFYVSKIYKIYILTRIPFFIYKCDSVHI